MTNESMDSRKLRTVLLGSGKASLRCRSLFKPLTPSINGRAISVTLVWSFAAFSVFHFVIEEYHSKEAKMITALSGIVVAALSFILGYAGDVYFGKHRVIRCSMCLMFAASILNSLGYAIHLPVVTIIAAVFLLTGFFGFQSCIVQLGLDQLYDSSSDEIISFITWHVWTFYASHILNHFSRVCICVADYKTLLTLLLPVLLTLALCSDFFFSYLVVKEPVTHNPFKLIFQVLKYAVKNKYPRLRSAFTYWDDKRYSRIDLAKAKFGGPFTTEQVEDVKTFFRISTVLCGAMTLVGIPLYAGNFYYSYRATDCNSSMVISQLDYLKSCFEGRAVVYIGTFLIVILVPTYQSLLYPLLRKFVPRLCILKKLCICVAFLYLRVFSCLFLELVRYLKEDETFNSSGSCFYSSYGFDTYTEFAQGVSYYWLALPSMCESCAEFILLVTSLEFMCAQSPYSMRGLLFGFTYSSYVLAISMESLATTLLGAIQNRHIILNCGVWFFLVCAIVSVIETVLLSLIGRWYKQRKRDDHLPSQHYFAERYYENFGNN